MAQSYTPEDKARVLELAKDPTLNKSEIARRSGVHRRTVTNWLRAAGISVACEQGVSIDERIARYTAEVEDGCWGWKGALGTTGYPVVSEAQGRKSSTVRVHRWRLEQKLGRPLKPGEVVRHTCDNPICTNPDHLIPGTQKQNVHDMTSRDRAGFPTYSPLQRERALSLRRSGMRVEDVCQEIGVAPATLYNWCREAGLTAELQPPATPEVKRRAVALYLEGKTIDQVAALVGYSRSSVKGWCRKVGARKRR